ncbi:MAG: hypothetical protein P8018_10595 [Acidobacteriota bacterium]|jgi:hypothetical protein
MATPRPDATGAALQRRFLVTALPAWLAGSIALLVLSGWRSAAAFALTFLVVGGDFIWVTRSITALMKAERMTAGLMWRVLPGFTLRILLLLLLLYGILSAFPREFIGVVLGIGGPLVLLAVAGAIPNRG